MLINGREQRLNICRKCEALSRRVWQRLSRHNLPAMWRSVPRPRSAGAGHGEQFHTSADRVTCDNPLWADKVSKGSLSRNSARTWRRVSQGSRCQGCLSEGWKEKRDVLLGFIVSQLSLTDRVHLVGFHSEWSHLNRWKRDSLPNKQGTLEYSWRICEEKINVLEIKMGPGRMILL